MAHTPTFQGNLARAVRPVELTVPGARFAYLLHRQDAMLVNPPSAATAQRAAISVPGDGTHVFLRDLEVVAADGTRTCGDVILTGTEDPSLDPEGEQAQLGDALDLALDRGAEAIGLSATAAARAHGDQRFAMQSGLSDGMALTAGAAFHALELALSRLGRASDDLTGAILGANGVAGCALAGLLGERVSRLVLIGDARYGELSGRQAILGAAERVCAYLASGAGTGPLATNLQTLLQGFGNKPPQWRELAEIAIHEGWLVVTTDRRHLRLADLLVICDGLRPVDNRHLPVAGVVCDLRRPRAISRRDAYERADVLIVDPVSFEPPTDHGPSGLFGMRGLPPSLVQTLVMAMAGGGAGARRLEMLEPWHASCALLGEAARLGFRASPLCSFQTRVEEHRWDGLSKLRPLPRQWHR
ncbi:MAG: hypothetical protein AAFX85_09335 [Pseudomonadota bacterium]